MENTALITLVDFDNQPVVLPFRLPIAKTNALNVITFGGHTYFRSGFQTNGDNFVFVQNAQINPLKDVEGDVVRPLDLTDISLVEVLTEEDALLEGKAMMHAVGAMWGMLQTKKDRVFSVRYKGHSILTMTVDKQNICRHLVGKRNRPPEPIEYAIVSELLQPLGVGMDLKLYLSHSGIVKKALPGEHE